MSCVQVDLRGQRGLQFNCRRVGAALQRVRGHQPRHHSVRQVHWPTQGLRLHRVQRERLGRNSTGSQRLPLQGSALHAMYESSFAILRSSI